MNGMGFWEIWQRSLDKYRGHIGLAIWNSIAGPQGEGQEVRNNTLAGLGFEQFCPGFDARYFFKTIQVQTVNLKKHYFSFQVSDIIGLPSR